MPRLSSAPALRLLAGLAVAMVLGAVTLLPASARDRERFPVSIDVSQIGSPPDAATSASDMAAVLAAQDARTSARQEQAIADSRQTLSAFLGGLEPAVNKKPSKKARALFKDAAATLEDTLSSVKSRFNRTRPFRGSEAVKPCAIRLPPSSSFPSTHAATGTLFAALLAHIAPERTAELEARGLDYGWSRIVCGFHYPSDVEAGRTGGRLVAAALLADPAFVARLDGVRKNLRATLGL
ncbi:acid phosphatase [Microvirga antarctica]|uniref:acid phosphatase n=1 Tax=Microvirga antarctica TaxID=2819233 RepID=UPI001B30F197|nr:phosphatase PAP2 family protein [Microvirga antarctica]